MKQPGVQVLFNKDNGKIFIYSSSNCATALRQRVSAAENYIKTADSSSYIGKLPAEVFKEIKEKQENIFDAVYIFTYNKERAFNFFDRMIPPSKILNMLKSYVRNGVFFNNETYGLESWYIVNKFLSQKHASDMLRLIDEGILEIYKTTLKDRIGKKFNYEKISLEELIQEKNKIKIHKTPIIEMTGYAHTKNDTYNYEGDVLMNNEPEKEVNESEETIELDADKQALITDKLLEIEAILRGYSNKHDFVKHMISDKAMKIYEIANRNNE